MPHNGDWERLDDLARLDAAATAFSRLVGSLVAKEERWIEIALLEAGSSALDVLAERVEDPADSRTTWSSPFLEIRYPVPWDWDQLRALIARWDGAAVATEEAANREILNAFLGVRDFVAMSAVTHWTRLMKEADGEYVVLLREEERRELLGISEVRRRARLDELVGSLDVGLFPWVVDEDGLRRDLGELASGWTSEHSRELEALLNAETARHAIPPIRFEGNNGGVEVAGSILLSFEPLILDPGAREAYFPITIGIAIDGGTPGGWEPAQRAAFWKDLARLLDEEIDALRTWTPKEIRRKVPDAFPGGLGDIPVNPATVSFIRSIFAAGPRARRRTGGWSENRELGGPQFNATVRRLHGEVVITVRGAGGDEPGPWGIVDVLDAHSVDVTLAVLAQICADDRRDDPDHLFRNPVLVTARAILRDLGLARRPETVRRVARDIEAIQRLVFRVRIDMKGVRERRPSRKEWKDDRVFEVVEAMADDFSLGDVPTAWRVRPGEWARYFLNARVKPVWVAKIPAKLLRLPRRETAGAARLAKKIGLLLMMESRYMPRREIFLRTLLTDVGELERSARMRYHAGRLRERTERALEMLIDLGILRSVGYRYLPGADRVSRAARSADPWLDSKVIIEVATGDVVAELGGATAAQDEDLWTRVRRRRDALNLTLGRVARLFDIDAAHLSRLERGKVGASADIEKRAIEWIERTEEDADASQT